VFIIFAGIYTLNPDKSPIKTIHQRLLILEEDNAQLKAEQAQIIKVLTEYKNIDNSLKDFKIQTHSINQSLITITSDIAKLNNMLASKDLSYTYDQEVIRLRNQIDTNMKVIAESVLEPVNDK